MINEPNGGREEAKKTSSNATQKYETGKATREELKDTVEIESVLRSMAKKKSPPWLSYSFEENPKNARKKLFV